MQISENEQVFAQDIRRRKSGRKKKSAVSWVLTWAGQKKSSYVWSVILAVINVVFKIVPYFIIADVVRMFLDGDKDLREYMVKALIIAGSLYLQSFATVYQRHVHTRRHLQCLQISESHAATSLQGCRLDM